MTTAQTIKLAGYDLAITRSTKRRTASATLSAEATESLGWAEETLDPTPRQLESWRALRGELREWASAEGLLAIDVYAHYEDAQDVMMETIDVPEGEA